MSRHRGADDERAGYDPRHDPGGDSQWDSRGREAGPGLFDPYPDEHDPYDAGRYPAEGGSGHPSGPLPTSRQRRGHARQRRRAARRRRIGFAIAVVVLVVLGVGAWQLTGRLFTPAGSDDYVGTGTGSVSVTIESGDGASAIGDRLVDAGIVKSTSAFVDAAQANTASASIQPGTYQLHSQMSGVEALNLLLNPSSRLTKNLTIPEGTIAPVALQKLAATLGVSDDQMTAAAQQIGDLGLPTTYTAGGTPTSIEGFLFPATYSFDPGTSPQDALRKLVIAFTNGDREAGLSDSAAALGFTPYQMLIAASIAQAEVKNPADAGKVVRVILNRLAVNMPLQIDATSVYAAELAGLQPNTVDFATYGGAYNGYLNQGLPPTPIDSPGTAVLESAIAPPAGDWLYYVNGDAAGNLFFTSDPAEFAAAAQKCADNNWGCASQSGG